MRGRTGAKQPMSLVDACTYTLLLLVAGGTVAFAGAIAISIDLGWVCEDDQSLCDTPAGRVEGRHLENTYDWWGALAVLAGLALVFSIIAVWRLRRRDLRLQADRERSAARRAAREAKGNPGATETSR